MTKEPTQHGRAPLVELRWTDDDESIAADLAAGHLVALSLQTDQRDAELMRVAVANPRVFLFIRGECLRSVILVRGPPIQPVTP